MTQRTYDLEAPLAQLAIKAKCSANFARLAARKGWIRSRRLSSGMSVARLSEVPKLREALARQIARRGRKPAESTPPASATGRGTRENAGVT